MTLKEFWADTGRWLRAHKPSLGGAHQPEINDDGLISQGRWTADPCRQGIEVIMSSSGLSRRSIDMSRSKNSRRVLTISSSN